MGAVVISLETNKIQGPLPAYTLQNDAVRGEECLTSYPAVLDRMNYRGTWDGKLRCENMDRRFVWEIKSLDSRTAVVLPPMRASDDLWRCSELKDRVFGWDMHMAPWRSRQASKHVPWRER